MILPILMAGAMLLYSSYLDIKDREIPDTLWLVSGAFGVGWTTYSILVLQSDLRLTLISIFLTSVIAFPLYYAGFYGGADAKGLLALSLFTPIFYSYEGISQIYFHPFLPISTLTNGVIAATILSIFYFTKNLARFAAGEKLFEGLEQEPILRKLAAMFLGYRVVGKPGEFMFRLETKKDGKRKLEFNFLQADEEYVQETDVWVTPGIPLLLFITAGYFISVLYGDLVAVFTLGLFQLI